MTRIFLYTIFVFFLVACGKENNTTEQAIASNNLKTLKARRGALQAEITLLDDAIAKLDTIKDLALVSVEDVRDTVFTHYVELQGNIATKENILIQPEMSGALTQLLVKAGQKVSKGQLLGRIDDAGMSQQVAQLETQLELAKTTYERQKRLWSQKIGSEIQYLQAETTMKSQQKAVAQARAMLGKTLIKAPFDGTIDQVFVERGQVVAPSMQGLMRIVNLRNMYVATDVPERYIGKVKKGSIVIVDLPSLGKSLEGKIRQVADVIDASNRTFGIEVAVANPDNILRPNQVAKLKIIDYQNPDAIIVPSQAIQVDSKGVKYVYVATSQNKKNFAKKVVVTPGESSGNYTEIIKGLNAGDKVVTEGANTLSEGMSINF